MTGVLVQYVCDRCPCTVCVTGVLYSMCVTGVLVQYVCDRCPCTVCVWQVFIHDLSHCILDLGMISSSSFFKYYITVKTKSNPGGLVDTFNGVHFRYSVRERGT